jgi:NADPH:quinone reductase
LKLESIIKAVLCKRHGPPSTLVVEDLPSLVAAAGEVVIDVHACGVNFPDTLIIENKYQFKPELPFSPGGEVAGTIRSIGAGVGGFAIGDRVVASPGWGGFAEQVRAPVGCVLRLPDGVRLVDAAACSIAYGTTHYALRERAALQGGETLLVLGAAGGTGLSAVEIGKMMGARVIAAASSEDKLALCRAHGADETINYSSEDLRERLRALTNGRGVDVVYDPVGGAYSEIALRSMAWKGRLLVIGFTAGDIPKLPINLTLLKGCSIVGVFHGGFQRNEPQAYQAQMTELFELVAQGRLKPAITARYPLEQAARALQEFAERRVTGKVVLVTERGLAHAE